MKLRAAAPRRQQWRDRRQCPDTLHCLPYDDEGLYREEYFREALSLERKRTERSGTSFLLMAIYLDALGGASTGSARLGALLEALAASTREIDTKGWLEGEKTLGIIFPDTNAARKETVLRKITAAVTAAFGPMPAGEGTITCHLFPSESGAGVEREGIFYSGGRGEGGAQSGPLYLKRALDIAGSAAALVIAAPVLFAIALSIKLSSRGPVLFRQQRVGRHGRPFTLLKFRTMADDSDPALHREYVAQFIREQKSHATEDSGGAPVYKITHDPRVTPLGRFLRRSSLDELPQFLNVLSGDMSLVGPRPPIPYELDNYAVWHKRRVMEIRPGITGPWQVKGRSRTTFDEMVRMDLKYIREWSLLNDLKLLLQTPWAVLTTKGSY